MDQEPLRSLDAIRIDIDQIDAELVQLLSKRAELAIEVGKVKGVDGKPFFTPERERAIFQRLEEINPGPLRRDQLISVFREIISAARAAESPLQIGFWGPNGTFSHRAALQTFGHSVQLSASDSITDVFSAVERGICDYGVVPIENSVAGVIPETLDNFAMTTVRVCAETYVPITHHLVSRETQLSDVDVIFAGPQPRAQCRKWLKTHCPNARIEEVAPTTRAVERALEMPRSAAVANDLAAELYQIPILADKIEDHPHNRTRFLVIGFNEPKRTGRDKTSLMFNLRNQPGALYQALGAFQTHAVNLLMIESRPSPRGEFEYMFFCDAQGHRFDDNLRAALDALRHLALDCVVLGSFPDGETAR